MVMTATAETLKEALTAITYQPKLINAQSEYLSLYPDLRKRKIMNLSFGESRRSKKKPGMTFM